MSFQRIRDILPSDPTVFTAFKNVEQEYRFQGIVGVGLMPPQLRNRAADEFFRASLAYMITQAQHPALKMRALESWKALRRSMFEIVCVEDTIASSNQLLRSNSIVYEFTKLDPNRPVFAFDVTENHGRISFPHAYLVYCVRKPVEALGMGAFMGSAISDYYRGLHHIGTQGILPRQQACEVEMVSECLAQHPEVDFSLDYGDYYESIHRAYPYGIASLPSGTMY